MKKALICLFLTLVSNPSKARIEGGWDSGGGSGYAAEFTSLGRDLASTIDSLKGFPVSGAQFLDTVQKTKIEFVDTNLGKEGAKRFPQKNLLQLSPKIWKPSENTPTMKQQIVVHQYLLMMGLDDSNYRWTHFVLDGGRALRALECTTSLIGGDSASIRWIDTDGDGRGDKYTGTITIRTALLWASTAYLNIFPTEQGVVLNWIELTGGVHVLLPSQSLNEQKSFKTKINKIGSYADDGTPLIKDSGSLTCKPIKP